MTPAKNPLFNLMILLASLTGTLLVSADTIAYYAFEGSLTNSITGGVGGAMMNGTVSYSASVPVSVVPRNGQPDQSSLDLTGNRAISFNQAFPFNTPGNATVEFWVQPTQQATEQDVFWTTTVAGDANRFNIFLGNNTANGCTFNFDYREPNGTLHPLFNSQQPGGLTIPFTVPLNQWTFVAVTRVGNTYAVYFNNSNTPAATVVDVNANLPTNHSWSLNGRYVTSGSYGWFSGQVDEIRLSNTALTPNQFLVSDATPPSLTQPTNLVVAAGMNATFAMAASGTAPLTYQWLFNGMNLANGGNVSGVGTSVLSLTPAQFSDAGSYTVVVSNAYGAVTSSIATLVVTNTSCDPPPSGLVAWWPGDGNANDIVGGNNGTLQAGASFTNGEVGMGFAFNSINEWISVGSPVLNEPPCTICAWVKPSAFPNDTSYVMANGGETAGGIGFFLYLNTINRTPVWAFGASSAGAHGPIVYSPVLSTNFAFLCGVWEGPDAQVELFVDGIAATNSYTLNYATGSTPYDLTIGDSSVDHGDWGWQGVIDEVQIFNRALSPNEIAAIYNAGSAGMCLPNGVAPAIVTQPTNQVVQAGGSVTFAVSATGATPLAYQWLFNGTNLEDNSQITGCQSSVLTLTDVTMSDDGTYEVVATNTYGSANAAATLTVQAMPTITWTNPAPIAYGTPLSSSQLNATANVPGRFAYSPASGAVLPIGTNMLSVVFTPSDTVDYLSVTETVSLVVTPDCDPPPSGLVAWWPGEGDATDIVGANNGTLYGGATFTNGEVGLGFHFDGVSNYVSIPDSPSLNPTNAITVEAWYKPPSFSGGGNDPILVKPYTSWGDPYYQYILGVTGDLYWNGRDYAEFDFGVAAKGTAYSASTPPGFWRPGNWYHIVGSYDGSFVRLFVNGTLVAQQPATGTMQDTGNPVFLGYNYFANNPHPNLSFLPGVVDEVSIYNRALSSNEVAAIYNAGSAGMCSPNGVAPALVTHPTNQVVPAGGSVTFAVSATGATPLAYQWLFNGTNLEDNSQTTGCQSSVLTLTDVTMSDDGTYEVVVTNTYGSTNAAATLTVSPATLTITANNTNMTYGGAVPAISVSYSGFVNGDTPASLTTAPSVSTTGTSASHAGGYAIIASGAADPNYNIVYMPGTLAISPAPLTITASNASKTYGQTATLPATAFNAAGLLNGDTIVGVTLTSAGAAPTAGTGPYPINATNASGSRAGNYAITYVDGALTVNPAPLTVTANNASKYAGQTLNLPGTAFTPSGLQNGDTVGSVTLTSTGAVSTATVAGSPYPIVPSAATGGTFAPANYTLNYVNGLLTVNPVGVPPAIGSVLPSAGPNTGGTTVTIAGTGFEPGATVSFGSLPATMVTAQNSNLLAAVTPASISGTVGVTVNNPDGNSVTASGAFQFGNAPAFTMQPTTLTVNQGQTGQFQVAAMGDPALAYQWQYNGANLLEDSQTTGTRTPTLTINNAVIANDGYYRCVVTNLYASVASAAGSLGVIAPPTAVTISPPSLAVGAGGSASLSSSAGGTTPFSYYWYQNGGLLSGQSGPVLNLSNVQASASYTVAVANAAGSVTSAPVALTVLGYCATVQTAQALYPEGTNFIPLNVKTLNCGSGTPLPYSTVAVWIYIAGTSRMVPVTTDGSGNGTAYFTPLPVEVGLCQYAIALPGQPVPAPTGSFTIIGMDLSAQSESPHLIAGVPQTNTLLLHNLTAIPLTGITATISNAPPDVNVQVSAPGMLSANASAQFTYVLETTDSTPTPAQFAIQFTSAEGASVTLPFNATLSPLTAQLAAVPASLVGTMIEGSQTLVSFTLTNSGGADSGPLEVNLPSAPWLSVVTAQPIPSLAPGQSGQIMLALMPTNGQQLGEYTGEFDIQGSNSVVTVPFAFAAVSTLTGNLQVTVQDELSIYGAGNPNVSNATVTVNDFLTGTNLGVQVTGSSGSVTFNNLISAYYTVTVEAPNHGNFSTTLLVPANQTTPVTAFLPLQLVNYTWTVTPTTIPDSYDFTLTTVFVTEVPWPVLTVSPGAINLCDLAGTNEQVDLVITNSGLIAAEGLQLVIDNSNPDWSIVPLVTNLGNVEAESSIVVPVIITRIGSSTSVESTIPAVINWYVAALNLTEYNTTPIFIYNANPLNCEPTQSNPSPPPTLPPCVGCGSGGVVGGVTSIVNPAPPPSYTTSGAIVNVTLQIDQTAVITANAFHATLNLENNSGAQVTDLQVTITPVNANGNPAPTAFFIQPPLLSGLNAVDGTGSLPMGASAQANWTLVPTTNAAPFGVTSYAIGGTLSYMLNGEPVTIPLFAVPITVLPEPQLALDYFLQHDVYSQDPFTNEAEPPIPFALGLQVRNLGLGVANDFTITSARPTIINNANGLLINFQIISSQVGTNATPVPSLTLDMGDIDPGTNAVGIWWLTASLEGDFTNFQATFQHTDALGGRETSLVNSVKIHELNHVVEITCPSDDGIPDFLCNDTTNVDALPDDVYSSDGNVYPVTYLTGATTSGVVAGADSTITINDVADFIPAGFVYFQLPDPSGGQYVITSVKRSDGKQLLVGANAWQTPERIHMVPPQMTNLIHIFDCNSTGSYTVTYGLPVIAPAATTLAAGNVTPTNVTLAATVNPDGATTEIYFQWGLTTNYGNFTETNVLSANLDTPQAVPAFLANLLPGTTIHFRVVAVNSVGTSYGGDESVVTASLPPPTLTQVTNRLLIVGQHLILTNHAVASTPPIIYTLGSPAPEGASITTNGVFTWTPACAEGSTTNLITVWAMDSGHPPLSNSMTFVITVSECVEVGIGSTVLQVGQSGSIPVTLLSTVGITNLSFAIASSGNRFTNWTITASNTAIAAATVQAAGSSPPAFTLLTQAGQTLQSPSVLGSIAFTALPGGSAFLPMAATNIIGIRSDGSGVGNISSLPGQVVLIGSQPLLAASREANSARMLTLYANSGSNYLLVFSTNLASTNWLPAESVLMTNLQQNINVNQTTPQIYFRTQ